MGINPEHLTNLVIRPTLERLNLWSAGAEQLILGIAIQESNLTHLVQFGGGPAKGLFQMEVATHNDIWKNYLNGDRVKLGLNVLGPYTFPDPNRMIWDLAYACAMCRIHLWRCPDPVPAFGKIRAQAEYWKKYYNTPNGAGTVEQYLANWEKIMGGNA